MKKFITMFLVLFGFGFCGSTIQAQVWYTEQDALNWESNASSAYVDMMQIYDDASEIAQYAYYEKDEASNWRESCIQSEGFDSQHALYLSGGGNMYSGYEACWNSTYGAEPKMDLGDDDQIDASGYVSDGQFYMLQEDWDNAVLSYMQATTYFQNADAHYDDALYSFDMAFDFYEYAKDDYYEYYQILNP